MKLIRLTAKESSGEQALDGVYHITIDLKVAGDRKITLDQLQQKVAEAGDVEDMFVEKYATKPSTNNLFNTGDTIELLEELNCTKDVYLDTSGHLIISDRLGSESVEKVGEYSICLAKGTLAEVNNKPSNGNAEILFAAQAVEIPELNRIAYLGILELPCSSIAKAE